MSRTRARSKIVCAACGKRIRAHQPDLVLEPLEKGGARPRYYHTMCGTAAYAAAAEKPTAYLLTVRHVEGAVN
jgi:hypothetical protein